MPLIRISALPQATGIETSAVLRTLCTELARSTGARPESFWATWSQVAPGGYVEGDSSAEGQPASTHPPFVEIVAFEGRRPEEIERLLTRTAEILARELRLDPGNVFVLYREAASGRVFTGGSVRRT